MAGDLDTENLREELFERVRTAAAAFYAASGEHARAVAEFCEMLDHPDGATAVLQAARYEGKALQDYDRAVKALSDFLALER